MPVGGIPAGGRPAGVDGREGGCGTTGGRGIAPVGRPLEITRDSPLGAAGAAGRWRRSHAPVPGPRPGRPGGPASGRCH